MFESGISVYKLINANNIFLLIISLYRGWSLFVIDRRIFSYFINFKLSFVGFLRLFTCYFKIKGFGFKFIRVKKGVSIKVGYTHRVLLINPKNYKLFYLSKSLLKVEHRNIVYFRQAFYFLYYYFKQIIYKKLGIYIKGVLFRLKLSKKKLKF